MRNKINYIGKIDLRFHGKISRDINIIFNRISYKMRNPFNEFVTKLSRPFDDNLDWWVEGPASRNTYSSPLFHYFCCIELLRFLAKENKLTCSEILVDSLIFADVIKKILLEESHSNINVKLYESLYSKLKKFYKKNFSIYVLIIKKFFQIMISRFSIKKNILSLNDGHLVLIDTFMFPGYINHDRWYGNLWENIDIKERTKIFFIPTLVNTPLLKMNFMYKSLRSNDRNYLIKEDYLTFSDLWFSLNHWKRIGLWNIAPLNVSGIDISKLIKEELRNNSDKMTVLESLLTYRFIGKLKDNQLKIRLAIDWFEGQVIDKAWNLGFKHFYPKTKRIGYRAFESFSFYLCSYPIKIEKKVGAIPDTIALQGNGSITSVKEFFPKLDTLLIPSFKSEYVWIFQKEHNIVNEFNVLIALPISLKFSKQIVRRLLKTVESPFSSQCKIYYTIKPHPTHSKKDVKKYIPLNLPDNYSLTYEKILFKVLKKTNLLVTEASSTCLEAFACCIPVVIMKNNEGLSYDPIPKNISSLFYRKVNDIDEFINALNHYINLNKKDLQKMIEESNKIKKDYFEPITKEKIASFLELDLK